MSQPLTLRTEAGDELLDLADFEVRARHGEISPQCLVRFPAVTGEDFVPACELELWKRLHEPWKGHFARTFKLARLPWLTASVARKLLNILPGNPFFHAWVVPALGGLIVLAGIIAILKGYHRRFAVFSGVLRYLFFFIAGVVFLEVMGTFVFANTALYRFGMVPLEEVFELAMGGVLWLKLRDLYRAQP